MIVNIIVAYSKNNGIGKNNALLWNIKSDMAKFKKLTTGNNNNAIIMGKNTYISLNNENGLSNRDNLILSKSLVLDKLNGKNIVKSFTDISYLHDFIKLKNYDELWVIGGEQIYKLFLDNYKKEENNIFNINSIYITYIDKEFESDSYFPNLKNYVISESNNFYENLNFYNKMLHKTIDKNFEYNIYDIIYKYI